MSISFEELIKVTDSLKVSNELLREFFQKEPQNIPLHKALRDSCIQRFEFCVELSWKTSMKVLGLPTKAPNSAIREMAQNNLIDDIQLWFSFLEARNKTSHTYDEDIATSVYSEVARIIPELDQLISKLQVLQK